MVEYHGTLTTPYGTILSGKFMTYGDFHADDDEADSLLQHRKKMFKVSRQIKSIACNGTHGKTTDSR
jgi:hypothetical protein